jgi:uncharacterized protein YjiS (DUF1127 family)
MKLIEKMCRLAHFKQLRRSRYKRTFAELSRLSDRELSDIGICRYDIPRIARGANR